MRNLKTCTTCKTAKPEEGFAVDKRRPSGRNSQCRQCQYDAKKNIRDINKAKAVAYKGGKCNRCGLLFECLDVYDFHHRDPNEKEEKPNQLMYSSWEKIVKEIDKCDLLCSNCHKLTHWELRNGKG